MTLYHHVPHPHLVHRAEQGPVTAAGVTASAIASGSPVVKFNTQAAVIVTRVVGTMWCAYAFTLLALYGFPAAVHNGPSGFVQWASSQFIQLVLLPIIIVGGNVTAMVTDRMSKRQFDDVEALLHGQNEQAAHFAAQDEKIIAIEDKILAMVTAIQENTAITTEARDAAVAASRAVTAPRSLG